MTNDYKLPLTAVRPDSVGVLRELSADKIPIAPNVPYSKHSPPHFMENGNKDKYLILGK